MKGSATPGELSITLNKTQTDYLVTHTDYVPACLSTVATTLTEFVEALVEQLRTNNKERIRETYACAMNRFLQFRGGHDIALDAIGSQEVEAFENHLKQAGLTLNTVSFYMRVLRAIYNKAVRQLSITDKRPFDRVFTHSQACGRCWHHCSGGRTSHHQCWRSLGTRPVSVQFLHPWHVVCGHCQSPKMWHPQRTPYL